jgi:choline dehydrogenase-like flavoprotein
MRYDVVIVGGRAAGCVLDSRLAANPQTSVLLLEAEPDYPDPAIFRTKSSSATPLCRSPKLKTQLGIAGHHHRGAGRDPCRAG